ncbi:hypothetical protein EJ04DRAFT_443922 [Polyplosphaeria fusca]|uniref:DUF7580 domain-containing protein n=1 Tax=Polyplosphaeria fusca TaxID=682080 RepID=A0A9P4UZC5_9PLEO|nr:hypothetical protein EJ04DRAFT_443922 [Polyplosphaeria fusca]
MSGFEIAGVVLGAFPIAIEALDKYRELARMWGFWWEIRSAYQTCSLEVKFHRLSFRRNLQQLLLPMVADQEQIKRLLADPGGEEWHRDTVEQQLIDRLQDSYELYLEIIKQLQRTMQDLNTELAVDKAGVQDKLAAVKAPTDGHRRAFGRPNREYQLYRAKFAIGEARRKELFGELKDYNERLEKLLTTSDAIAQLTSKRSLSSTYSPHGTTRAIGHIWRHADRLHTALSKAWNCGCSRQHSASIFLQHRAATELEFLLLFLDHATNNVGIPTSWGSRQAKIKLVDPPTSSQPFRQITISTPAMPRSKPVTNANASVAVKNSDKIQDLCITLSSSPALDHSYGFLEDDHKRYHIYPSSIDESHMAANDPVTLDDLLRRKHQPSITRRQRYALALIIASSFVRLSDSAWLPSALWMRSDIAFPRDADNRSIILLDQPYIGRSWSDNENAPASQSKQGEDIPFLGIILLELCFGSLVEEHPRRQAYPFTDANLNQFFDQLVAVEWLRDVVDEAGPDFADAATWCLVGSRSLSTGDDWRRTLYEKVVQPLERCHSYLNPVTTSKERVID